MSRRRRISRKNSRKNFSAHAIPRKINAVPVLTRGGFRL